MSPRKLLLIGWDAADWNLIHPLLDQGQMPNLQRIIESGVMGRIATMDPPVSPLLWNSIATGKTADEHNILGFLEPDPVSGGARVSSSTSRGCKAVWNILQQNGLRPHVVNWFASHPAEPLRGVCVSNAACQITEDIPAGAIHPPELTSELLPLRLTPRDLRGEDLALFIPQLERIDQSKDSRVIQLARTLSEGLTAHAMVTWILERQEWDFVAVYLDTIDHVGHQFMIYHPPKMAQVREEDYELYKDVMTGVYRMHDLMLGRLAELAGPNATIMIVSDHGFLSGDQRPPEEVLWPGANPVAWHRQYGIFCLSGPGIRQDELVQGAGLLDVTPTILSLFGLPAGQDMKGRVLVEAFEEPPELERVPSWEAIEGDAGMHAAEADQEAWDTEAAMQQLAELGYIEAPSEDLTQQRKQAVNFQNFMLARVHLSNGRPVQAIPLLEELAAESPGPHVTLSLGQAYFRAGQYELSEKISAKLLAESEVDGLAHVLRANSSMFQKDHQEALAHLAKAKEAAGADPQVLILVAQAYRRLKRFDEAEANFRKVLEIDPDRSAAWCGLATMLLLQRRYREAAEAALEAVGRDYSLGAGHYLLGVALAREGSYERAVVALENCIKLQPGTYLAHRWLQEIHTRVTGDTGRADLHRERAEQIDEARRESAANEATSARNA